LYVTEEDYERERDLLEGLREFTASLQLKLLPEGPLPLLAGSVLRQPAVNLLQGKYLVQSKSTTSLAPWRYAAALAGVLFITHVAYKVTESVQLARQEAEIDAAIQQVFQAAMPGAPEPTASQARSQMEARLTALRGATVSGGLLGALDTLSSALQSIPGTQLEALSYRSNTADLRLTAPNVDALEQLRQNVAANGANADIQSATPRDNRVEGRVQLKTAGA
jgi:general secretion pathway protein L